MIKDLDGRLEAVLSFVNASDKVADIGADHGYLSKAILDKGSPLVQVVENKKSPLNNAVRNLKDYDNVLFSLSDGIKDVNPDIIDTIVIAGMGGLNIVKILNDEINKAKRIRKFILQPNSKVYELRLFLNQHNFEIVDEQIVSVNNHFYNILVCKPVESCKTLTDDELLFGPILLKRQDNLFKYKYQMELNELNDILKNKDAFNDSTSYESLNKKRERILRCVNLD